MTPTSASRRRHLAGSPFNVPPDTTPVEAWVDRDRVSHDRYGLGYVVAVEGEHAVVVDFGGQQVRIVAPFAKLTKL